jgi:hypothetical protein
MGRPRRLPGCCKKKGFSEMESEEPCDYDDHYDYADDVENIYRSRDSGISCLPLDRGIKPITPSRAGGLKGPPEAVINDSGTRYGTS